MRNKNARIFQSGGFYFCVSLSVDCIEPDSGMNPAEAAEEAPSDPDTDAFYKTGRKSRQGPRKPAQIRHKSGTTGVYVSKRRLNKRMKPSEHQQKCAENEQKSAPCIHTGSSRVEADREAFKSREKGGKLRLSVQLLGLLHAFTL